MESLNKGPIMPLYEVDVDCRYMLEEYITDFECCSCMIVKEDFLTCKECNSISCRGCIESFTKQKNQTQ